jgi:hypothetical protein
MGDIEEMFLQVEIPTEDRPLNRFLWSEGNKLIIYESTVHMFGKNNSPSAASYTIVVEAKENRQELPEAYETVM